MNLDTYAMAAMTADPGSLPTCFADTRRSRTAACARPGPRLNRSAPPVRCQSHLVPAPPGRVVFYAVKKLVTAAAALVASRTCVPLSCVPLFLLYFTAVLARTACSGIRKSSAQQGEPWFRIADLLLAAQQVRWPFVRTDQSCR